MGIKGFTTNMACGENKETKQINLQQKLRNKNWKKKNIYIFVDNICLAVKIYCYLLVKGEHESGGASGDSAAKAKRLFRKECKFSVK